MSPTLYLIENIFPSMLLMT